MVESGGPGGLVVVVISLVSFWILRALDRNAVVASGTQVAVSMDLEVVAMPEVLDKTEQHLRGGHGGLNNFHQHLGSYLISWVPGPGPAGYTRCWWWRGFLTAATGPKVVGGGQHAGAGPGSFSGTPGFSAKPNSGSGGGGGGSPTAPSGAGGSIILS